VRGSGQRFCDYDVAFKPKLQPVPSSSSAVYDHRAFVIDRMRIFTNTSCTVTPRLSAV
jgi:hypothetical protein